MKKKCNHRQMNHSSHEPLIISPRLIYSIFPSRCAQKWRIAFVRLYKSINPERAMYMCWVVVYFMRRLLNKNGFPRLRATVIQHDDDDRLCRHKRKYQPYVASNRDSKWSHPAPDLWFALDCVCGCDDMIYRLVALWMQCSFFFCATASCNSVTR